MISSFFFLLFMLFWPQFPLASNLKLSLSNSSQDMHDRLVQMYANSRKAKITSMIPVDWATAEAMSFGSLLQQGIFAGNSNQFRFTYSLSLSLDQVSLRWYFVFLNICLWNVNNISCSIVVARYARAAQTGNYRPLCRGRTPCPPLPTMPPNQDE